jgi:ADP-heptose:LPS heptosyltransferase
MKVLISAFTGLGNAILLTPLIQAVRDHYGEGTEILLLGDDKYLALSVLKDLPGVRTVKISDKWLGADTVANADLAFLPRFGGIPWLEKPLRKHGVPTVCHYDQYLLNPFHRKYSFASKAKLVAKMLTHKNMVFVPVIPGRHEVELNLDLLRQYISRPVPTYETKLGVDPDPTHLTKWGLKAGDYILLQPSAANGSYSSKRWAPENFINLIRQMTGSQLATRIVLIGDQGDRDALAGVQWPENVMNLMGATAIGGLVSLIKFAKLTIAHDSGAMHLAVALKAPLISLLGPTDFYRTGPFSKEVSCLFSNNEHLAEMHGFNLSETESSLKSKSFEAMNGISVDEVYSAVERKLEMQ